MTDARAAITGTRFATWSVEPLQGDASSRRYARLRMGQETAILMQCPLSELASLHAFMRISGILRDAGLCAPRLFHLDEAVGIAVIEDLGADHIATCLRKDPTREDDLYAQAVDALGRLAQIPPPPDLIRLTADRAAEMLAPTFSHYAPTAPADLRDAISDGIKQSFAKYAPTPDTLSLRDYHAENLIWREGHTGVARLGLLDFQDAFAAPAEYDLASLLRDIRRQVSPDVQMAMQARFADQSGRTLEGVRAACAVIAVQRNLRILGVFARLTSLGKPQYAALIPATEALIHGDADHPAMAPLASAIEHLIRCKALP